MQPDLKEIVEQYGVMVSSIAHRMIQNKEIAKEAAQEVWYEIIKSIDSFNGESGLSTWIYTICKRTILRYARNERIATMNELREFRELPAIDYNGQDRDEQEWIKSMLRLVSDSPEPLPDERCPVDIHIQDKPQPAVQANQ